LAATVERSLEVAQNSSVATSDEAGMDWKHAVEKVVFFDLLERIYCYTGQG
jgi:hypothetical protein